MRPMLTDGQRLLVSRLAYHRSPPQRGDLVVLRDPIQPDMRYVKRIVGLPGEHVQMDGGNVAIDGEALVEPYAQGSESATSPFPNQWVPDETEFFVLGDQRRDSRDSRTFGPVRGHDIIGKVWVRYWPPRVWGRLG